MEVPPSMLFRVFFHFYFVDALPERAHGFACCAFRCVLFASCMRAHSPVCRHVYVSATVCVCMYAYWFTNITRFGRTVCGFRLRCCCCFQFCFSRRRNESQFQLTSDELNSTIHHSIRIGSARALCDSKKRKTRLRTGTL